MYLGIHKHPREMINPTSTYLSNVFGCYIIFSLSAFYPLKRVITTPNTSISPQPTLSSPAPPPNKSSSPPPTPQNIHRMNTHAKNKIIKPINKLTLTEIGFKPPAIPVVYCDNIGATYLCANLVFHSRMKHIALDYHFVRNQIQAGVMRVSHVSTKDQLADCLTKPLPRQHFQSIRIKLGVSQVPPA